MRATSATWSSAVRGSSQIWCLRYPEIPKAQVRTKSNNFIVQFKTRSCSLLEGDSGDSNKKKGQVSLVTAAVAMLLTLSQIPQPLGLKVSQVSQASWTPHSIVNTSGISRTAGTIGGSRKKHHWNNYWLLPYNMICKGSPLESVKLGLVDLTLSRAFSKCCLSKSSLDQSSCIICRHDSWTNVMAEKNKWIPRKPTNMRMSFCSNRKSNLLE